LSLARPDTHFLAPQHDDFKPNQETCLGTNTEIRVPTKPNPAIMRPPMVEKSLPMETLRASNETSAVPPEVVWLHQITHSSSSMR
jgi:hypothetical protein